MVKWITVVYFVRSIVCMACMSTPFFKRLNSYNYVTDTATGFQLTEWTHTCHAKPWPTPPSEPGLWAVLRPLVAVPQVNQCVIVSMSVTTATTQAMEWEKASTSVWLGFIGIYEGYLHYWSIHHGTYTSLSVYQMFCLIRGTFFCSAEVYFYCLQIECILMASTYLLEKNLNMVYSFVCLK